MGLLDALFDSEFRKDVVRGLLDAGNRGVVGGLLGAPVDLATMALRPLGYNFEAPVGGSEWIGKKMQDAGLVSANRNPVAEALAAIAGPMAVQQAGPKLFAAEQAMAANMAAPAPLNAATRGQGGAIVWHGSPHKFDKFDASKIGTGEGAQAYGHGLYLAENQKVAEAYKESNLMMSPRARMVLDDAGGDLRKAAVLAKEKAARMPEYKAAAEELAAAQLGSLYKVDLPDSAIAKMLDWDKPLSKQSPEVQKAVESIKANLTGPFSADMTGDQLLRHIQSTLKSVGRGPEKAEGLLGAQGIPGIRYLDGGSRGTGQGTSNYVVFPGNESLLQILERNGLPLAP